MLAARTGSIPNDVTAHRIPFQNGTNDNHVVLLGHLEKNTSRILVTESKSGQRRKAHLDTELDTRTSAGVFGELGPGQSFSGAKGKGHS